MTHKTSKQILTYIAEESIPSPDINLWPKIVQKVSHRSNNNSSQSLRLRVISVSLIVILLTGILIFVPQAQATVEHIIDRLGFAIIDEDELQDTTVIVVQPNPTVEPTPNSTFEITEMVEADTQSSLDIYSINWLPPGLQYATSYTSTSEDASHYFLLYTMDGSTLPDQPQLALIVATGEYASPLLAESSIQQVQVNGQPAMYAHGGWETGEEDPTNGTNQGLVWNDLLPNAWLTWEQHDAIFLLQATSLSLDAETMIRIAVSIQ